MANTFVEPASVTVFLQRMLDDGGMKDVEPEIKNQMLNDLRARLENKLFATMVMKLPEVDLPALDQLITAQAGPQQIQQFLRQRIPNLEEIVAEAMLEFRKEYVKE